MFGPRASGGVGGECCNSAADLLAAPKETARHRSAGAQRLPHVLICAPPRLGGADKVPVRFDSAEIVMSAGAGRRAGTGRPSAGAGLRARHNPFKRRLNLANRESNLIYCPRNRGPPPAVRRRVAPGEPESALSCYYTIPDVSNILADQRQRPIVVGRCRLIIWPLESRVERRCTTSVTHGAIWRPNTCRPLAGGTNCPRLRRASRVGGPL